MTAFPVRKRDRYIHLLKEHDAVLRSLYPYPLRLCGSQGWGTNLARCGVEASLRLLSPEGVAGIVSPSSLLADQMFGNIRRWVLSEHCVHDLAFYAAEARLFENVDQASITIVASRSTQNGNRSCSIDLWQGPLEELTQDVEQRVVQLRRGKFYSSASIRISCCKAASRMATPSQIPGTRKSGIGWLWAGRELDETGYKEFLSGSGDYLFLKGRM